MSPSDRMRRWPAPCLMLITDRSRLRGRLLEEVASQAVDGGANIVQLREKELSGGELYEFAVTLRAVLRGRALFFVNDRADVAFATGADGVHLPEQSVPIKTARKFVGESCLIGRSVHSLEAAMRAEQEGADYVVAGAVFASASKHGRTPAGVSFVREVADAVRVPVVAVGGITEENIAEVVAAGASGVAVIGAIMDADDPREAASRLRRRLDESYG